MRLAFRVARPFGITVRVHLVFVLMFGVLLGQTLYSRGADEFVHTATRFLVLFLCVVLHELGHSLAAQAKGIRVYDIVLWPLGGMARLERIPRESSTELVIAAAGPAVNFFLVLALLPLMLARGEGQSFHPLALLGGTTLEFAVAVNLGMGLFNLIPAFPLDGGRILRALIARRVRYEAATRLAVVFGRAFAIALAVASYGTPWMTIVLVLVAFVWWVGAQELRQLGSPHPASHHVPTPGARRFLDLSSGDDTDAVETERKFGRLLEDQEGGG